MSKHAPTFLAIALLSAAASAGSPPDMYGTFYIFPSDGQNYDKFGDVCALDDGVLVVGSHRHPENGDRAGAAYLFDVLTGTLLHKLLPEDPAPVDYFGWAVAIDGDVVAVSSYNDNGGAGSVYLFSAATGEQITKITPEDAQPSDQFGQEIVLAGGLLIASAPYADTHDEVPIENAGAIYVFDVATETQVTKIVESPQVNGRFGWTIDSDGSVIVARSPSDESVPPVVYAYDALTGVRFQTLSHPENANSEGFGAAVAIEGNSVAVSSSRDTNQNGSDAGRVDVYNLATGSRVRRILSEGIAPGGDHFGVDLDIDQGILAISAPGHSFQEFPGCGGAFLHDVATGDALLRLLPTSHPGANHNNMGDSITIDGGTVVVGSPTVANTFNNAGIVYVFRTDSCPGDLTTTGTGSGDAGFGQPDSFTNLSDLLFFVNAWNTDIGTPSPNPASLADVTSTGASTGDPGFGVVDGNVDLSDLLFYVNDWTVGLTECP